MKSKEHFWSHFEEPIPIISKHSDEFKTRTATATLEEPDQDDSLAQWNSLPLDNDSLRTNLITETLEEPDQEEGGEDYAVFALAPKLARLHLRRNWKSPIKMRAVTGIPQFRDAIIQYLT